MPVLLFESIAFGISLIAFIYGFFTVYLSNSPMYFKLMVSAVGCYTLEELWVIVNAICGVENDTFSIRLIGIIGCYCTFLTASSRGLTNLLGKDAVNKKAPKYAALIAPLIVALIFAFGLSKAQIHQGLFFIAILMLVFLPMVLDSYFELRSLLLPMDEKKMLKSIKLLNILVLIQYVISLSYMLITGMNTLLVMDVVSAVGMALIVIVSRKGALIWKA